MPLSPGTPFLEIATEDKDLLTLTSTELFYECARIIFKRVMTNLRTPTLRKSTRDPKTGKLHHRQPAGHLPSARTAQGASNLPKPKIGGEPNILFDETNPSNMPTIETQTDYKDPGRDDELHEKIDSLVGRFNKVKKVEDYSEDYKESLEFTQEEILELKEENHP